MENSKKLYELPVGFVPTPTNAYRLHRKNMKATVQPGKPVLPSPIPVPIPLPHPPLPIYIPGPRVLMYKQDPSVAEIGIRKAWLPTYVFNGPKDSRIEVMGMPNVVPLNAFGDMIETPDTDDFDAVHTFAVVRQTLTMYQRLLNPNPAPWQWNGANNTDKIQVFPHAGVTMNAYYSRTAKCLKFFYFVKPGDPPGPPWIYTCRSLDIVSHETGHAILDGLKPNWLNAGNPPQTGGLHESFGDLTAIFLALSQLDLVEAVIAQTKANLHNKTFIADLAEQFGLALGRPNGLRNADNDLKLSDTGTEVHAISQVFTGAIYDILADIFQYELQQQSIWKRDAAIVLYECAQYVMSLVVRALRAAPDQGAIYADVANQMLGIAGTDGKPAIYRNFIRNRFTVRQVVVSPMTQDVAPGAVLKADVKDAAGAVQNRLGCCGTMQLHEYFSSEDLFETQVEEFRKALTESSGRRKGKG